MTERARRGATERPPSLTVWMSVRVVAATVLLSSGAGMAMAQEVQLGVDFLAGVPRSEFSSNLGANGYGVSAFGLCGIPHVPLRLGAEVGYMIYGSQERREPLSPTIPDLTVKVRTSNSILTSHLLVRLQPRSGSVRAYVDGMVGFKYLYTRTSVRGGGGGEPIAASTNLDDWALSYGAGGGVQVLLHQVRPQSRKDRPVHILLDARLRYLWGSHAAYLTRGSLRQGNDQFAYDISRSRTDMLITQLGITFRF